MTKKTITREEAQKRLESFTNNVKALAEDDGIDSIIICCGMDLNNGRDIAVAYAQRFCGDTDHAIAFSSKTLLNFYMASGKHLFIQSIGNLLNDIIPEPGKQG